MATPPEAVHRVRETYKVSKPYFRKVNRLRRIVAGDREALEGWSASDDTEAENISHEHVGEFRPILVTDIEEGRSNKLLQAIRTLVLQTTYHFPEVEADDLETEDATLLREYFRQRLGPEPMGCGAITEMRRALYDYLIGGFGWVWVGIQNGKPIIRYVDTLDTLWDQAAPTLSDARWWSCTQRAPLKWWMDTFGKQKFTKFLALEKSKHVREETPIDLQFYYDIEGTAGTFMVLHKSGEDDVDDDPIIKGSNPCIWTYGREKVPFLPSEPMFFMELPNTRHPIGIAEQMLPSQVAIWRADEAIQQIIACPAFYEVVEGSLDEAELQKFEDAEVGSVIRRKGDGAPIQQHQALEVPHALLNYRAFHEGEMQSQSGANPFASGEPLEGTNFAAEVHAIQGASGLMSGTIAKDNAEFWIRTLRKFLAKGAVYDNKYFTARFEDVTLEFDEANPINIYLQPHANLTIRENSMQFVDPQSKIMLAKADFDMAVAANMATQGMLMGAVLKSYENYLRARGETNVSQFLQPTMPPAAAPPAESGGGPGGQPPSNDEANPEAQ